MQQKNKLKDKANTHLNNAISLFQKGDFEEAQQLLKKVTGSKQAPALAWFVSAIIYVQTSNIPEAINAFKKAIARQPIYPDAHNNLGVALELMNDLTAAKKHYLIAVQQRPDYANALFNLGNICHQLGSFSDAEQYYLQSIRHEPQYIKAHNNLGLLYQQNSNLTQAKSHFERALQLSPNDHEILNNVAYTYHLEGNDEAAMQRYNQANQLCPDNAEILNNTAIVLQSLKRFEDAENYFKKAIELRKDYHEALSNIGGLYKETNNIPLAKKYYLAAITLYKNSPAANTNYGLILHREGLYSEAKKHFEQAIIGDEHYKEARYNLAVNQLLSGDFLQGWKNYQYRVVQRHPFAESTDSIDISNISNKTILLTKEQGIGDELFFLRFSRQLHTMGARLNYLSSPKIAGFIRQCTWIDNVFIDESINESIGENSNENDEASKNTASKITDYDIAISIADLPTLLTGTDKKINIPPSIILSPSKKQKEKQKDELIEKLAEFGPPPYIGIAWRGGQQQKGLLYKSIPITPLLDAIGHVNATFISIQRLPTTEEENEIKQHPRFSHLPDLSSLNEDLPQMLSLLSLLDDYTGVSNTNIHLLSALGKTANVLIPHPPDWRWMLEGNESPWFPGINVLRQAVDGSWSTALSTLTLTLERKYGRST